MADLTLTAASVIKSAQGVLARGTAGATLTAGSVIYYDPADKTLKASDANAAAPLNSVTGIALNGASAGQPVDYVSADPALTVGAVLTAGLAYFLSATPGHICPATDLASGMTGIFLGMAVSTSVLNFNPTTGGNIV